jgi:predicted nucleic acid-binding protein
MNVEMSGVKIFYSEDLQDGLMVGDRMAVINPFIERK